MKSISHHKQHTILALLGRQAATQANWRRPLAALHSLAHWRDAMVMGLFSSSAPKVYKPAPEVDLGPESDEHYISPNVKAARVAGLVVKILAWVLETPVVGAIVLSVLKRNNLVNKLVSEAEIPEPPLFTATHIWQDIPEQNVCLTKASLSPAECVQEAVGCLPARLESTLADDRLSGFRRWTIQDFSKAYSSGQTTAVMESCGEGVAGCSEGMFISCDAEDVMRQAEKSTLRYHQAALVRYSIAGNFLCLPAITVPVGYGRGGLPVGLQFIGRPWSEATLMHLAYAAQEGLVGLEY
ncbi:hypothetical protein ACP70R_009082 [Stipagrostis hirtigluma subsp. patula]